MSDTVWLPVFSHDSWCPVEDVLRVGREEDGMTDDLDFIDEHGLDMVSIKVKNIDRCVLYVKFEVQRAIEYNLIHDIIHFDVEKLVEQPPGLST